MMDHKIVAVQIVTDNQYRILKRAWKRQFPDKTFSEYLDIAFDWSIQAELDEFDQSAYDQEEGQID